MTNTRRFKGDFDNGVAWDRVPPAPTAPEKWFNPSVPPCSTENLGVRFPEGVPSWVEARMSRMAKRIVIAWRTAYYSVIFPILRQLGREDIDPRHIEAYLRLEYNALDGLSRSDFARAMPDIIDTIDDSPSQAERLARSYGM